MNNLEEKGLFDIIEKYSNEELNVFDRYFKNNPTRKMNWGEIIRSYTKDENFVRKYSDNFNWIHWNIISNTFNLSEDFMNEFEDKIIWRIVSRKQKLSECFIEKHSEKLNWNYIYKYQDLSDKFLEKHQCDF